MHFSGFLLLLPAALVRSASLAESSNGIQTWTVTRLDYHYMTEHPGFGPPHTEWPEDRKFASEISFDISIPDGEAPSGSWKYTCEANWEHGVLPDRGSKCVGDQTSGEDVMFWVSPCKCPNGLNSRESREVLIACVCRADSWAGATGWVAG